MSGKPKRYNQSQLPINGLDDQEFKRFVQGQLQFLAEEDKKTKETTIKKIQDFLQPYIKQEVNLPKEDRIATRLEDYTRLLFDHFQNNDLPLNNPVNLNYFEDKIWLFDKFFENYGFGLYDQNGAKELSMLANKVNNILIKRENLLETITSTKYKQELDSYLAAESDIETDIEAAYYYIDHSISLSNREERNYQDLATNLEEVENKNKKYLASAEEEIENNNKAIADYPNLVKARGELYEKIQNFPLIKESNERLKELVDVQDLFKPNSELDKLQKKAAEDAKEVEELEKKVDIKGKELDAKQQVIDALKEQNDKYEELNNKIENSKAYDAHRKEVTADKLQAKLEALTQSYGELREINVSLAEQGFTMGAMRGAGIAKDGSKKNTLSELNQRYDKAKRTFLNAFSDSPEFTSLSHLFLDAEEKEKDDGLGIFFDGEHGQVVINYMNAIGEQLQEHVALEAMLDELELLKAPHKEYLRSQTEVKDNNKDDLKNYQVQLKNKRIASENSLNKSNELKLELVKNYKLAPELSDEDILKLTPEDINNLYTRELEKAQDNVASINNSPEFNNLVNEHSKLDEQIKGINTKKLEVKNYFNNNDKKIYQNRLDRITKFKALKSVIADKCDENKEKIEDFKKDYNSRDYAPYDSVTARLKSIQNRMGKLTKFLGDTKEYKAMKTALGNAITILEKDPRSVKDIDAALTTLDTNTSKYIVAKNKQTRLNPSDLRKLRLGAANDIMETLNALKIEGLKFKKGMDESDVEKKLNEINQQEPDKRITDKYEKLRKKETYIRQAALDNNEQRINDLLEEKLDDLKLFNAEEAKLLKYEVEQINNEDMLDTIYEEYIGKERKEQEIKEQEIKEQEIEGQEFEDPENDAISNDGPERAYSNVPGNFMDNPYDDGGQMPEFYPEEDINETKPVDPKTEVIDKLNTLKERIFPQGKRFKYGPSLRQNGKIGELENPGEYFKPGQDFRYTDLEDYIYYDAMIQTLKSKNCPINNPEVVLTKEFKEHVQQKMGEYTQKVNATLYKDFRFDAIGTETMGKILNNQYIGQGDFSKEEKPITETLRIEFPNM